MVVVQSDPPNVRSRRFVDYLRVGSNPEGRHGIFEKHARIEFSTIDWRAGATAITNTARYSVVYGIVMRPNIHHEVPCVYHLTNEEPHDADPRPTSIVESPMPYFPRGESEGVGPRADLKANCIEHDTLCTYR